MPAVEEMRILAEQCPLLAKDSEALAIVDADFSKFMNIRPGMNSIKALIEIEASCPNTVSLALLSKNEAGKSGITRTIRHASLSFVSGGVRPSAPPIDHTLGLEGICMRLDKDRIYRDLIPFKKAYQNIEDLFVSDQGALAIVKGGTDKAPSKPLGSPFPLDASFHAACVWGQRYRGIVGFPVRIDRRSIIKKTEPGNVYTSRITPVKTDNDQLIFDLWIYDSEGALCEEVRGLHMRDVTGKTLVPPEWILYEEDKRLDPLKAACAGLSLIELATVTAPCAMSLSPSERERFDRMVHKRGTSYVAARLALKKLSRRLSGDDLKTPANSITTIKPEGEPACPLTSGEQKFHCTASHDSRFAIAAASETKIGIDVEELSERVLKARHFYMHEDELSLVRSHTLGEIEASARVWTIKEAVSKATGMNLVEAWQRTEVKEIGCESSIIQMDEIEYTAIHAVVDGHIFTLLEFEN